MMHIHGQWLIYVNPLNAKLNPILHLLALLGAHLILHPSRARVKIHSNYICNYLYNITLKVMLGV
jgi:hypothetical protein